MERGVGGDGTDRRAPRNSPSFKIVPLHDEMAKPSPGGRGHERAAVLLAKKVLAELLDVSVNQISEMEKGTRMTTLEKLAVICQHYNVSADYLLGLTDERRPLREDR